MKYPPKPTKSKYRRTGTLKRRWTTKILNSAGEITGIVGNATPYAPYVQEREVQRGYHAEHGWETIQDVIEAQQNEIVAELQRAFEI